MYNNIIDVIIQLGVIMIKLFIDDERFPNENDWHIVRNMKQFKKWIDKNGCPNLISFDHDLGFNEPTGYDICKYFCNEVLNGQISLPKNFTIYVHSQNPIGKKNIEMYFANFLHNILENN